MRRPEPLNQVGQHAAYRLIPFVLGFQFGPNFPSSGPSLHIST